MNTVDIFFDADRNILDQITSLSSAHDQILEKLLPADRVALRRAFRNAYLVLDEPHNPVLVEMYLAWRRLVENTSVVVMTHVVDIVVLHIGANPAFNLKIVRCIQAASDSYSILVSPEHI